MAKTSRSSLKMALLLLAVLLTGIGAGTFVLADYRQTLQAKGWLALFESAPEPEPVTEPQFQPLEQFVIGLPGAERNHYMVLELALMSRRPQQLALWEGVLPALRNTTLSYFSGFDHDQVQAQLQDMSKFESELQLALNQRLEGYGYAPSVEAVLITKLVIQ
ncbi:flagellar basal body-associated protein FliL [Oceanimonas sp. GK1]|uniref:flagellar basal body-associated FliL family protein n=1 Tax=Oceanimonas sp. (strain GK1 / IBRC-M 10197) TaxID=511062 RepID=UPI0002F2F5A2|nr:flagellar basal body-associated FliL family protein [Oceanimonas sp. GK1]